MANSDEQLDDVSDRRLASRIIDAIGDNMVSVAPYRIGPTAENG